jgi:hypothetical protein
VRFVNDDWKSIVRQLTHSPHGRIVLYRDSLDDAISMLRLGAERRPFRDKVDLICRPQHDLFCELFLLRHQSVGFADAQHPAGEIPA